MIYQTIIDSIDSMEDFRSKLWLTLWSTLIVFVIVGGLVVHLSGYLSIGEWPWISGSVIVLSIICFIVDKLQGGDSSDLLHWVIFFTVITGVICFARDMMGTKESNELKKSLNGIKSDNKQISLQLESASKKVRILDTSLQKVYTDLTRMIQSTEGRISREQRAMVERLLQDTSRINELKALDSNIGKTLSEQLQNIKQIVSDNLLGEHDLYDLIVGSNIIIEGDTNKVEEVQFFRNGHPTTRRTLSTGFQLPDIHLDEEIALILGYTPKDKSAMEYLFVPYVYKPLRTSWQLQPVFNPTVGNVRSETEVWWQEADTTANRRQ